MKGERSATVVSTSGGLVIPIFSSVSVGIDL